MVKILGHREPYNGIGVIRMGWESCSDGSMESNRTHTDPRLIDNYDNRLLPFPLSRLESLRHHPTHPLRYPH